MINNRIVHFGLCVLSVASWQCTAEFARADVIYSTIEPGDTEPGIDVVRGGFSFQKVAAPFFLTGAQDYVLQTAELEIEDYASQLHTLNVRLFTGFYFPDTEVASAPITTVSGGPYLAAADFSDQLVTLSPGTKYWFEADLTGGDQLLWHLSSSDIFGAAYSNSSGSWEVDRSSPSPAFRLNGIPVPEPAAATLLSLGMLECIGHRRRPISHDRV